MYSPLARKENFTKDFTQAVGRREEFILYAPEQGKFGTFKISQSPYVEPTPCTYNK